MQTFCSHCAHLQNVNSNLAGQEAQCQKCNQTFIAKQLSSDQINYEFGDHEMHMKFGWGAMGLGVVIGLLPWAPFLLSTFIGAAFGLIFLAVSKIINNQKTIISQLNDQYQQRVTQVFDHKSPSVPSAVEISKQAQQMAAAHDEDDSEPEENDNNPIPLS